MTSFERIGHNVLYYALVVPPLLMVGLGMFCGGSVIYAEQKKIENAKFVSQIIQYDMRKLSEIEI